MQNGYGAVARNRRLSTADMCGALEAMTTYVNRGVAGATYEDLQPVISTVVVSVCDFDEFALPLRRCRPSQLSPLVEPVGEKFYVFAAEIFGLRPGRPIAYPKHTARDRLVDERWGRVEVQNHLVKASHS